MEGVIIYQDDILMGASCSVSLKNLVNKICMKLKQAGMSINAQKSVMLAEEVTFLGFKINSRGIFPDERLVKKILCVKKPLNKKKLEKFLGLINFYGKFIKDFAKVILPLSELMKSTVFFTLTQ